MFEYIKRYFYQMEKIKEIKMVQNNNIPPNQKYKTYDNQPWNDSLGRENFGVFFCNFLKTTNTPTVIELSAGYGEGKTTFLERCEKYIKQEQEQEQEQIDVDVININIWENDFNDNPFLALLESLNEKFGLEQIVNKKSEEHTNAIFDVAAKFFPIGVIPENIIKNIFLEKGEKKQKTSKDFIQEIKIHLEKKTKKTIVFIDELDRCRPDYAIRTLEVIKHIFNVKNIVFVLATDDNRLQSFVNSVYGSQVASEDYLRKFIDFQLFLPEAEKKKEQYDILNPSLRERRAIDYFNKELNDKHEKNNLFLISETHEIYERNNDAYHTSLSFMVSLRHMNPNLYYKIGNHEAVDIEDMISKLKFIFTIEDGFISELIITKEDIKNFIEFIYKNIDEQERFLKNIFGENNLHVVTGLKDLSLNGIRNANVQTGVAANGCKIRKYAVFIYLYKTFSMKGKSIAQQIYSALEN